MNKVVHLNDIIHWHVKYSGKCYSIRKVIFKTGEVVYNIRDINDLFGFVFPGTKLFNDIITYLENENDY